MVLVNSLLIWINSKYARGYFLYYTLQMVCYALGNGNGFTLQNTLFFYSIWQYGFYAGQQSCLRSRTEYFEHCTAKLNHINKQKKYYD